MRSASRARSPARPGRGRGRQPLPARPGRGLRGQRRHPPHRAVARPRPLRLDRRHRNRRVRDPVTADRGRLAGPGRAGRSRRRPLHGRLPDLGRGPAVTARTDSVRPRDRRRLRFSRDNPPVDPGRRTHGKDRTPVPRGPRCSRPRRSSGTASNPTPCSWAGASGSSFVPPASACICSSEPRPPAARLTWLATAPLRYLVSASRRRSSGSATRQSPRP